MKTIVKFCTISIIFIVSVASCNQDDEAAPLFSEEAVATHQLATYYVGHDTEYLVVFESGLGDDHSIWRQEKVADLISEKSDVLLYDRAGYGQSTKSTELRDIQKLSSELDSVITMYANGRKVILVGHSLGGMIIRDYAIKHPDKVAAIVFVDTSHEMYNDPTEEQENLIQNAFTNTYGIDFGATLEAKELVENSRYMATLPDLPDVPVVALTSMKIDDNHNEADRQLWYESHEALKSGVSDFNHIVTVKSGHYIMLEEPELLLSSIDQLLSKLNESDE